MRVVKDVISDNVYARSSNLNPVQTIAFPPNVNKEYTYPSDNIGAVPANMIGASLAVKSVAAMLSWNVPNQNNFGLGVFSITFATSGVVAQGSTLLITDFWNGIFEQFQYPATLLSTSPFCFCQLATTDGTVAIIQLQASVGMTPAPVGSPLAPDLLITFVTATESSKTYYGSESLFLAVASPQSMYTLNQ